MLKVWIGIGISLLIIAAYFGVLLVSSTKESDDKYVVGVLRTGYKIFEYFNRKKNNLGIYLSYIILWVGYMALNGRKPKLKKDTMK
ncbi:MULTISPECIES: hypothetical protein [Fusobacterium]|jgi:hypothetical protein|uniref:Uncharacterized protein n=1 Tax=Fusobacterium varium ATCC 27725 TaxID=469618 RepID=A0ABN5JCM1_FUSVA|nr:MULTISPECIES: hypothetical protein [Fusobacterium]AVQ29781.1 hypothetical protein C4N18_00530 [Fusobacterium varium ATCC 27725]EES65069.1 hypothetical protein FVAG_02049 [Fusobacterium varium ATCC 27725]MCF0170546.1 hypothetical protein [Fusobacterium varium]MCF2673058.1 hypothetical protein [Fusobacterium varium]MDY4006820.1 hypothetical protein [Fusobacterium varium]